jgi:hypothetical protein
MEGYHPWPSALHVPLSWLHALTSVTETDVLVFLCHWGTAAPPSRPGPARAVQLMFLPLLGRPPPGAATSSVGAHTIPAGVAPSVVKVASQPQPTLL